MWGSWRRSCRGVGREVDAPGGLAWGVDDDQGVAVGVDVEGVFARGEARGAGLGALGFDVTARGLVVGGTLCPVEAAGVDVEGDGEHLLDDLVVDDGDEEDEVRAIVDAGVGQEEAEDVGGAVGEGVAEDCEAGVDVVPTRVAEDGRVAVAFVPDVLLDALTPFLDRGARGGIGGAALEQPRHRQQ